METEFFTWVYWGSDKAEIIRNFGLAAAAVIGLPFLIWRTIAAHKSAQAAVTRSIASLKQSEASLRQSEISSKQAEAALEQAKSTQKQTELIVNNQFLEYLIKGFDQIASDNPSVRLGAIYVLERLAEESEKDRYPIMSILKLYLGSAAKFCYSDYLKYVEIDVDSVNEYITPEIEERFPYLIPEFQKEWPAAPPDVQAIMQILGGRIRTGILGKNFLSFRSINLQGVNLVGLDFSNCSFKYANLSGIKAFSAKFNNATLFSCILVGADFSNANLAESVLMMSKLVGASLMNANLERADLTGADLERANLQLVNLNGAVLDGVNFSGADLSEAKGLKQEQLSNAYGDEKTILPDEFTIPKKT